MLERIRAKKGQPAISLAAVRHLEKTKSGDDDRASNAREVIRKLGAQRRPLKFLSSGTPVLESDRATLFGGTHGIIVLDRIEAEPRRSNGTALIDFALSYDMILLSRNRGMIDRALALGVRGYHWEPRLEPFAVAKAPEAANDAQLPVGQLPTSGDVVLDSSGYPIRLQERLGGGGEGAIYATDFDGQVAKIYERRRLTVGKRAKIELMLTRPIRRPGICWPSSLLTTKNGDFVGYLMPREDGRTIQSSMFVKPVLEKTFPNWQRVDLVNVAIAFLEHMEFLHALNIFVGDINPMNLLVSIDSTKLAIVDTDSFQVERYPCPVGTVNFTPPARQGLNYAQYLRTQDDELFAVATMLFMILHPGKPPYAQQGGGTPAENIRRKEFAYWYRTASGETFSANKAPEGPWQTIWANLPWDIRGAFHQTFREDARISVPKWLSLFREYRGKLGQGRHSNELFPTTFPIRDPIAANCGRCKKGFIGSKKQLDKNKAQGRDPWCSSCHKEVRLIMLAAAGRRVDIQVGRSKSPSSMTSRSSARLANPPRVPKLGASRSYGGQTKQSSLNQGKGEGSTIGALILAGIAALLSF